MQNLRDVKVFDVDEAYDMKITGMRKTSQLTPEEKIYGSGWGGSISPEEKIYGRKSLTSTPFDVDNFIGMGKKSDTSGLNIDKFIGNKKSDNSGFDVDKFIGMGWGSEKITSNMIKQDKKGKAKMKQQPSMKRDFNVNSYFSMDSHQTNNKISQMLGFNMPNINPMVDTQNKLNMFLGHNPNPQQNFNPQQKINMFTGGFNTGMNFQNKLNMFTGGGIGGFNPQQKISNILGNGYGPGSNVLANIGYDRYSHDGKIWNAVKGAAGRVFGGKPEPQPVVTYGGEKLQVYQTQRQPRMPVYKTQKTKQIEEVPTYGVPEHQFLANVGRSAKNVGQALYKGGQKFGQGVAVGAQRFGKGMAQRYQQVRNEGKSQQDMERYARALLLQKVLEKTQKNHAMGKKETAGLTKQELDILYNKGYKDTLLKQAGTQFVEATANIAREFAKRGSAGVTGAFSQAAQAMGGDTTPYSDKVKSLMGGWRDEVVVPYGYGGINRKDTFVIGKGANREHYIKTPTGAELVDKNMISGRGKYNNYQTMYSPTTQAREKVNMLVPASQELPNNLALMSRDLGNRMGLAGMTMTSLPTGKGVSQMTSPVPTGTGFQQMAMGLGTRQGGLSMGEEQTGTGQSRGIDDMLSGVMNQIRQPIMETDIPMPQMPVQQMPMPQSVSITPQYSSVKGQPPQPGMVWSERSKRWVAFIKAPEGYQKHPKMPQQQYSSQPQPYYPQTSVM